MYHDIKDFRLQINTKESKVSVGVRRLEDYVTSWSVTKIAPYVLVRRLALRR